MVIIVRTLSTSCRKCVGV